MAIHEEVLRAARRICRERGEWTFSPEEIVRSLPHLNPHSVRTHIVSRCCIDAPKNHPHKWDYFRRRGRGIYEIVPSYRADPTTRTAMDASRVSETPEPYSAAPLKQSIHATISRGQRAYVAECLEVAVVTQGHTLDEAISNLKEAISLHLEGENYESLGLAPAPRLIVTYELDIPHAEAP